MLKYIGLIFIIAVTSFIGNYFSSALKIRLLNLKKVNYLIDEIIILIRFKAATVYEITEHLTDNDKFSSFSFLRKISAEKNNSFQQNWCTALKANPPCSLKASDIEILENIGRKLGTSDTEGQISMLNLQRIELETLISAVETDCEQKSKLYRSLGVLSGAFISVMLI